MFIPIRRYSSSRTRQLGTHGTKKDKNFARCRCTYERCPDARYARSPLFHGALLFGVPLVGTTALYNLKNETAIVSPGMRINRQNRRDADIILSGDIAELELDLPIVIGEAARNLLY